MSETIFKLSKPIKAHGKEVVELAFREPTGEDIEKVGFPYLMIVKGPGETGVEIRTGVMYQYISRLAAIPRESAKQIHPSDLSALSGLIMGFFGESTQEAETPSELDSNS